VPTRTVFVASSIYLTPSLKRHPIIPSSHHPFIPSSHHPIIPSSLHPIIPSSHHPIMYVSRPSIIVSQESPHDTAIRSTVNDLTVTGDQSPFEGMTDQNGKPESMSTISTLTLRYRQKGRLKTIGREGRSQSLLFWPPWKPSVAGSCCAGFGSASGIGAAMVMVIPRVKDQKREEGGGLHQAMCDVFVVRGSWSLVRSWIVLGNCSKARIVVDFC